MISAAEPNVNRQALTFGMITIGGLALSMLLTIDLLSGSGNSLAKLARAIAIAGLLTGFVNPRLGVYLLVLSTAYLDLFKRMLVFYDRPTMIDLYYVLGVAPLILGGVTAGVIIGGLFGKIQLRAIHWQLLGFAILYNAVVAAASFSEQGAMKAAAMVANQSFYSLLIFVIPALFQRAEDFWKLLRFAIWIFVPVAAYGIYQSICGLTLFEIAYLKSGLTIMVKELDDLRPRPFSTLSSCAALGFVSAIMFVLSLIPVILGRSNPDMARRKPLYLLIATLFLAATVVSLVRSANIVWLIALPALFFLVDRKRTRLFYAVGVGGYATLILSSNWLMKMLPIWDSHLAKSTPFLIQATRIQTFGDRLHSFNQLKKADTYSWFGLDHEIFTHDTVTTALARHGALPLALLAVIVVFGLYRVHRSLLKLDAPWERKLAALFMGMVAAIFAGGALFGEVFGTFPINTYWWLLMGGLMMMTLARSPLLTTEKANSEALNDSTDRLSETTQAPVPVPAPAPAPALQPAAQRGGIPFNARGTSTLRL